LHDDWTALGGKKAKVANSYRRRPLSLRRRREHIYAANAFTPFPLVMGLLLFALNFSI
jgi:hypothetical protein